MVLFSRQKKRILDGLKQRERKDWYLLALASLDLAPLCFTVVLLRHIICWTQIT